jgi:hypothetical protein
MPSGSDRCKGEAVKKQKPPWKRGDAIERAREAMSARRVYGKPVDVDGVTVIPAARVAGVGGGSAGDAPREGQGAGFGLMARPVGAFVIKDGVVRWKPAVDLLPLLGLGLLLLLVGRSIVKLLTQP